MERVERKKAHKKKTRGRRNMTRKTVWNWETKRPKRGAAQNEKHDRWTSNAHQKRPKQKKTKQKRKRKKQENTRVFCSVCKAIIDFPNKGPASARTNKHWPKTRKTGGKKKVDQDSFLSTDPFRVRWGFSSSSANPIGRTLGQNKETIETASSSTNNCGRFSLETSRPLLLIQLRRTRRNSSTMHVDAANERSARSKSERVRLLPGFTEFSWLWLAFTGFNRVLLGFSWFYWVSLGYTGLYWVLVGFAGFYWVLLGFTGFNWV